MVRVEFIAEELSFLSFFWDLDVQLHRESGILLDFAFYKSA